MSVVRAFGSPSSAAYDIAVKRGQVTIVAPLPNSHIASNGMARFVHQIANAISDEGSDVTVLCQIGASRDSSARYRQIESWSAGTTAFYSILRALVSQRAKSCILHHEIFLFGTLRSNIYLVLFLLVARIAQIRVIVTMHHALDERVIQQCLSSGEHAPAWLIPIFRALSKTFNDLVANLSAGITVHKSDSLKAFSEGARSRVSVIPLIISPETVEYSAKQSVKARLRLPERFVLAFGFVSKYKGLDVLMDAAALAKGEMLPLVISASMNVKLSRNLEYQEYYNSLKARAKELGIIWLSYVPEQDVAPLFASAEAIVLPYTKHHGSSGPLSIAASLGIPCILSSVLAIREFNFVQVVPRRDALAAALIRFNRDGAYRNALDDAISLFASHQSPKHVAHEYLRVSAIGAEALPR